MPLTTAQLYDLHPGDRVDLEGEAGARFVRVRKGIALFVSADGRRSIRLYKSALNDTYTIKPPTLAQADVGAPPPATGLEESASAGERGTDYESGSDCAGGDR